MGGVFFHLVPRLLGQSMELVQAKHMVEAEALLLAPGTITTSYFVFWIVQSQPIATTCVNVAIMMTITLLQWTQGTSAPLQRSVSRQSPSTCHTSLVSPPDRGNAFVLFPHCLNLLGKKGTWGIVFVTTNSSSPSVSVTLWGQNRLEVPCVQSIDWMINIANRASNCFD